MGESDGSGKTVVEYREFCVVREVTVKSEALDHPYPLRFSGPTPGPTEFFPGFL